MKSPTTALYDPTPNTTTTKVTTTTTTTSDRRILNQSWGRQPSDNITITHTHVYPHARQRRGANRTVKLGMLN